MSNSPDIPSNKADLAKAEEVYADLVALYPDNEGYLQQYAELLLASHKTTTATEVLKKLYDQLEKHAPEKAAQLARKYPQIGRVQKSADSDDFLELSSGLKEDFGTIWLHLHQKRLIEGEHLYRQGDTGDSLYLVLDGQLAAFVTAESGKSTIVDIIDANDFVGEASFLSPGTPRTTDVVANKKTTYVELPRKRLLSYLLENPGAERLFEYKSNLRQMLCLISSSPLLHQAPLEMRRYLAEKSQLVRYSAHGLIHEAGEVFDYVDMLIDGEAHFAVRLIPGQHSFTKIELIKPGDLIGDTSAVRSASCPADIVAVTDVLMAHIPLSAFTNVVAAYPPLREKLLDHAEEQRQHIMHHIVALGQQRKG